jgi:hypothetical protein
MGVDLDAVERELRRIPEVRAARIVADEYGCPIEVHVLATPGKHAKQLVRDVQSVAIASQGLELDHRIVSVVQLEDELPVVTADDGDHVDRDDTALPTLEGVVVERRELRCSATVSLRAGNEVVQGTAEGSVAAAAARRVVADATLAALTQLGPAASVASVEAASLVRVGERDVAVAVLTVVVPPYEEIVTGSAPVRTAGADEAVARAVLDACNRRLQRLA